MRFATGIIVAIFAAVASILAGYFFIVRENMSKTTIFLICAVGFLLILSLLTKVKN